MDRGGPELGGWRVEFVLSAGNLRTEGEILVAFFNPKKRLLKGCLLVWAAAVGSIGSKASTEVASKTKGLQLQFGRRYCSLAQLH